MERLSPTGDAEVARLDAILESLAEEADPRLTALLAEVVAGLHRLHAGALERLVEILAEEPETFGRVLADPLVANLFHLYDLVMVDEARRAREALDEIRPFLQERGGDARLLEMDDGLAVLQLRGACEAIEDLRDRIDRALAEAVPGYRGFRTLEEGAEPQRGPAGGERTGTSDVSFVSAENLRKVARRAREWTGEPRAERSVGRSAWLPVEGAGAVAEGELLGRLIAGEPVLVVRRGNDLLAFRNLCPGSLLPLHVGHMEEDALVCRWHGCRFRLPSGEEEGEGSRRLTSLAVREDDGEIRVEIPS